MATRTLSLIKSGHKYVFRYSPGGEDDVVDAIIQLAEDESSPVDWLDAATLKARLTDTLAHSQTVLERLPLPYLEATQVSPRDGREFTVAWCLAHALEHTALHLGQMQITRQLWERQGSVVSP